MTELAATGRRSRRKARAGCRADRHRYGSAQEIGGGILRRVCYGCGAVTIDLTAAEHDGGRMFRRRADLPDAR